MLARLTRAGRALVRVVRRGLWQVGPLVTWAGFGRSHRRRGWPNPIRSGLDLMWGREKDEREEGEKEKKKGEEREKESFRFVRVFETQFYTPLGFPKMKFHFRIFLIVFTIFNKYDTKMNFRVKTLN